MRNKLWANKISWDLGLRWVFDGYPILLLRIIDAFRIVLCWVKWGPNFTHILQGYFTGTGAITWLPQCQWSDPEGYTFMVMHIMIVRYSWELRKSSKQIHDEKVIFRMLIPGSHSFLDRYPICVWYIRPVTGYSKTGRIYHTQIGYRSRNECEPCLTIQR